jgi:hypothetical protein
MGGSCSTDGATRNAHVIGGKGRGREATIKTKT